MLLKSTNTSAVCPLNVTAKSEKTFLKRIFIMESKTILIVDDEEKNIKLLKAMLKSENYSIFGALSGEEGLKMVADISPDLILLDVLMPGIGGFEVCRRLKQEKKTRIRLIWLSLI